MDRPLTATKNCVHDKIISHRRPKAVNSALVTHVAAMRNAVIFFFRSGPSPSIGKCGRSVPSKAVPAGMSTRSVRGIWQGVESQACVTLQSARTTGLFDST
jgi:hypothetical protein